MARRHQDLGHAGPRWPGRKVRVHGPGARGPGVSRGGPDHAGPWHRIALAPWTRVARVASVRVAKASVGHHAPAAAGLRGRASSRGLSSATESGVEGAGVTHPCRGGWSRPLTLRDSRCAAPGRFSTTNAPLCMAWMPGSVPPWQRSKWGLQNIFGQRLAQNMFLKAARTYEQSLCERGFCRLRCPAVFQLGCCFLFWRPSTWVALRLKVLPGGADLAPSV